MKFTKTIKEVYVIKNRQGEIVKLDSGKFCWDSIASANSALAHHIRSTSLLLSRSILVDEDRIKK